MLSYSRSHLADHVLLSTLAATVTNDRVTTVEMLALIAEVDRRGLHRAHGYDALGDYLVERLGMSEDMVYKRLGAARVAREYPAVFAAVADGRLHLTAILKLRPYLTPNNSDELFTAAAGKTRDQIDLLLAERFPKADVPTSLVPIAPAAVPATRAAGQDDVLGGEAAAESASQVRGRPES